ncbi:hypothetical protein EYF80_031995 [Liparis tanakae]|uniref:Uncharacterized protein n=1 Tax=Liparis tanakae TaxID=230148 RepID=A0A4Z2GWY3_9TELE|nr:hypothetical protein EYF80_031995 [Liparis tanakae]
MDVLSATDQIPHDFVARGLNGPQTVGSGVLLQLRERPSGWTASDTTPGGIYSFKGFTLGNWDNV